MTDFAESGNYGNATWASPKDAECALPTGFAPTSRRCHAAGSCRAADRFFQICDDRDRNATAAADFPRHDMPTSSLDRHGRIQGVHDIERVHFGLTGKAYGIFLGDGVSPAEAADPRSSRRCATGRAVNARRPSIIQMPGETTVGLHELVKPLRSIHILQMLGQQVLEIANATLGLGHTFSDACGPDGCSI